MLRRKTLKNLTRLFTTSLAPLMPPKPRRARKAAPAKLVPAAKPRRARAKAPPPTKPSAGRWLLGVALAPAGKRRYRLFLPAGRVPGQRIPLLVMLHGCDQNATGFAASTRMHLLAARAGFALLYPEQDRLANPNGCWNWHETRTGRAFAEAALILQAIEQVCTLYGADRSRVAIAGLSAGAGMAALVAARYPERFRAVAMHSGVPPGTADSTLSALTAMAGRRDTDALAATPEDMAAHWPALLVIQGGQDRVVAPRNGEAAVQAWAQAAGARPGTPREVQRGQRHPMRITDYRARQRTVATLVEVPALGHAWSGGAAAQAYSDPAGPDASRLVWAFAQRAFTRRG
ncbi:extracellular catalytic domain type 1 short-chain-length polyhydroxyalkanoate depolymerase [Pseudorhodoferax sp.]|uniref:extracellular catalytic domain type 1 short-chain-length polyhydroxyalkanoate depolymerase n=1 Tax=Pseudorhodoferax sp. TaxID=1993553 RepID=UPI002DD65914|nr:PHB depolymerase family esterase [Pseudorhodoferax sp.]